MSKYTYFNKLALLIIIRQHSTCAGLKESREKTQAIFICASSFVPRWLFCLCLFTPCACSTHTRMKGMENMCTQTMHFAHCENWDSKCDENNMKTFNVIRWLDAWAKVTLGFRFIRNGSKIRNPTVNNNKESVRRRGTCRRKFDLQSFARSLQSQTISLLAPISWIAQSSCNAKSILIIWFWYQNAHTHTQHTPYDMPHYTYGVEYVL